MVAPARRYSSSTKPLPTPAPVSTSNLCSLLTSSSTPPGVAATLYSLSFISLGTPMIIVDPPSAGRLGRREPGPPPTSCSLTSQLFLEAPRGTVQAIGHQRPPDVTLSTRRDYLARMLASLNSSRFTGFRLS